MTPPVPDAPRFIHVLEALLSGGHAVRFRAPGWSMYPTIRNGDAITVVPLGGSPIQVGDVVLYRSGRAAIAHRVIRVGSASSGAAGFMVRGDAAYSWDGPIQLAQVLGRVSAIERAGHGERLDFLGPAWSRAFAYTLRVTSDARAKATRFVDRLYHKVT